MGEWRKKKCNVVNSCLIMLVVYPKSPFESCNQVRLPAFMFIKDKCVAFTVTENPGKLEPYMLRNHKGNKSTMLVRF